PGIGRGQDLVGAAGGAGNERPHRRHARRAGDGNSRPPRRDAGGRAGSGARPPGREGGAGVTARFLRELSVVAALGLLLLVMAIAAPAFFGSDQVRNMLVAAAPTLVAAVGMTLVILCRHIDISIGSQVSVCGIAAGLMAQATVSMPLVVVATVAAGALLGMANGWLVAHFNLPSIVVPLATLVIFREGLRWGRGGEFVCGLP